MPLWNPTSLSVHELEIARGNVPHVSLIRKFGRNSNVGGLEDVWTFGGLYNFLQASSPLRIQAGGDANDTAGGTGARSVILEGLDDNLNPLTATLITNGILASADTLVNFRRLFRAYIPDNGVGTYGGNNIGNIIFETNPGGIVVGEIASSFGQTQMAIYTIPNGKHAFLGRLQLLVENNKAADASLFQRPKADVVIAPFAGVRLISAFNQVTGQIIRDYDAFPRFEEKTDIWVRASNPTAATALSAEFELWLVDNGF